MLRVRSLARKAPGQPEFDIRKHRRRVVGLAGAEHVCLDLGGEPLRLDVIEGSVLRGPVCLEAAIGLGGGLSPQMMSLRRIDRALHGLDASCFPDSRVPRLIRALRAMDAAMCGASLRAIARRILGASEWPGEGEYAKSSARRLVTLGKELMRAGPAGVLRREI